MYKRQVYVPYEMDTPTTYGYVELPVEEKLFSTSEEYMEFLEQKAKEYEEENGEIHFLELDSSNPVSYTHLKDLYEQAKTLKMGF